MTETPQEAANRLSAHVREAGFKAVALHAYHDENGQPLFWKARLKHPNPSELSPEVRRRLEVHDSKWIRPFRLNGHGFELGEPKFEKGKKPIYGLHLLKQSPDSAVWVVEGELKADRLIKIGILATTSGSASSADAVDWTPLRGREVMIWPDNDTAGKGYAGQVAQILLALGCTVSCIDIAVLGLPDKGDVVDWLAEHPNAAKADVLALKRLPAHPAGTRVRLISGASIRLAPVTWVWDGWLACGALHILAGAPGTGKTTLALALAATLTSGGRWPDGSRAEQGEVVIWSGEDSVENTLAPRLKACGADLRRVQFVSVDDERGPREFDPGVDMPLLREALAGRDVRLLILDPIVSAVTGDSHKSAEVRRSLQPVRDLAEAIGCVVLGISHYTKGTAGRDPVERVTGSIAFGAVPRLIFGAAKEEEGGGRIFVRAKNNLGPDSGGFRYDLEALDLEGGIPTSRLLWGDPLEGNARELLATAEAEAVEMPDDRNITDEAEKFLRHALSRGRVLSSELKRQADAEAITQKALRRARERLGVAIDREGFGKDFRSYWRLSLVPSAPTFAHSCPSNGRANVGTSEGEGKRGEGDLPVEDALPAKVLTSPKDAHHKGMSTLEVDEHHSVAEVESGDELEADV